MSPGCTHCAPPTPCPGQIGACPGTASVETLTLAVTLTLTLALALALALTLALTLPPAPALALCHVTSHHMVTRTKMART